MIAAQQSLEDTVNQVGQEMTRRNLDIQPTLTELRGLQLRVIVNKDLVVQRYPSKSFNVRVTPDAGTLPPVSNMIRLPQICLRREGSALKAILKSSWGSRTFPQGNCAWCG